MSWQKWLKVALRSRSVRFAGSYRASERKGNVAYAPSHEYPVESVRWGQGDGGDVWFRSGSSDTVLVYDILFKPGAKSEYWLPAELDPKVIFDIGGNIGVTTRYLAHRFPEAEIHVFEPIASNLALLRRNAVGPRIRVHEFGLGSEDGEFEFTIPLSDQTNEGGYSRFADRPVEGGRVVKGRVRKTSQVLAELGVEAIDLIKIDTEGAEFDILTSFPEEVLSKVSWIYGELHSKNLDVPSPFRVLDFLSPWFEVELAKPMRTRNPFFDACNSARYAQFKSFARRKIR